MEKLAFSSTLVLIKALKETNSNNVELKCQDGNLQTYGPLLASLSPLIREIGKTEMDVILHLPDFNVHQLKTFLRLLVSENGPITIQEKSIFNEVLHFFSQGGGPSEEDIYENDLENFLEDFVIEPAEEKFVQKELKECYDDAKSLYVCNFCGVERKTTRSIQQHLAWHEKYPQEDFHTSHICKECGKVCADHSLLRAHVRLVHSPRTFECTQENCRKTFKSKEGLKQHLLVHSGVKNFQCSTCGYRVRTKHHLKLHTLKRHTEMKKEIPCEVCGKLFRHMSNLKCHFYTHKARQEREHRCEPCGLTFRTQKSLDSHLALHDPNRPFKCSKCPLRYKNKDALVAHENTHLNNQYKCQFCDIAYTRKDNLKRHVKEKHS